MDHKTHHPRNNKEYLVPNIVHYVSFYANNFPFYLYVSMRGVDKFIKPAMLIIWGEVPDTDVYWWTRLLREVPNIYVVPTERYTQDTLFGKDVPCKKVNGCVFRAHDSDAMRLRILLGKQKCDIFGKCLSGMILALMT